MSARGAPGGAKAPPVPPTVLKLDLGPGPLRVEVSKPPAPSPWWRRNLAWVLVVVVIVAVIGAILWRDARERPLVSPDQDEPFRRALPELGLTLVYPARLYEGDTGTFDVQVVNRSATSMPAVKVAVVFSDTRFVSVPITGSNVLDLGALAPGETKHREFSLRLVRHVPTTFSLWVAPGDGREAQSTPRTVDVGIIPYLNRLLSSVIGWLIGTALVSTVVALIQRAIKGD